MKLLQRFCSQHTLLIIVCDYAQVRPSPCQLTRPAAVLVAALQGRLELHSSSFVVVTNQRPRMTADDSWQAAPRSSAAGCSSSMDTWSSSDIACSRAAMCRPGCIGGPAAQGSGSAVGSSVPSIQRPRQANRQHSAMLARGGFCIALLLLFMSGSAVTCTLAEATGGSSIGAPAPGLKVCYQMPACMLVNALPPVQKWRIHIVSYSEAIWCVARAGHERPWPGRLPVCGQGAICAQGAAGHPHPGCSRVGPHPGLACW